MHTKHVLYDKLYLQLILLLNNVLPSITFSFPSLLIFTVCVCASVDYLSVCLSVCRSVLMLVETEVLCQVFL